MKYTPKKADPNRTHFIAGAEKCNYPYAYEVVTPTVDMFVARILFTGGSTLGPKFMTIDISNFYIIMPFLQPAYIRIKITELPDKIIQEYIYKQK